MVDVDEGDDSKIRRNLVVFSALIVSVAWLELPVAQIASGFFKLDTPLKVSPLKLWILCLAVLVYLSMRYRFATEGKLFVQVFNGHKFQARTALINKLLARELKRYQETGIDPTIFLTPPSKFSERYQRDAEERVGRAITDRPLIEVLNREHSIDVWSGIAHLTFKWEVDEQPLVLAKESPKKMPFAIPKHKRVEFEVRSTLRALAYSEASVRHVVPVGLALMAFLIVIWNLLHSL